MVRNNGGSRRILVLATGMGGGNWPPLATVTIGLHRIGHIVKCYGDATIARDLAAAAAGVEVVSAEDNLRTFIARWREAGGLGPSPLRTWADACLPSVRSVAAGFHPQAIVSELFTVELARLTKTERGIPYCFLNPGYYFGPDSLRPPEADFVGISRILGAVPPNARIEQFVPHSAVPERSCLLISHAGHGIVTKALGYGVPMVLVPWGRDQPGVAARAAALGVAEVIPRQDLTEARLALAIRKVLGTARYREEAARIAGRMQGQDTVASACARIAEFMDKNAPK